MHVVLKLLLFDRLVLESIDSIKSVKQATQGKTLTEAHSVFPGGEWSFSAAYTCSAQKNQYCSVYSSVFPHLITFFLFCLPFTDAYTHTNAHNQTHTHTQRPYIVMQMHTHI